MLAVVAAVVLAVVHIHFALFNNCIIPQTVLAHGVLTWFLLDRFACKDFPWWPIVAYIDLPMDLPITSRFAL